MGNQKDTKAAASRELTDDTEVWVKSLSILAGIRQVRSELLAEIDTIRAENPGIMVPPGYGSRSALAEALKEADQGLSYELLLTAKSSGLTMPAGLR